MNKPLHQLWHSWDVWWTRTGPPHGLAILRIAFGIFLMIYIGTYVPFTALIASSEGLVIPKDVPALSFLLSPPSPFVAYLIVSVLYGVLVLFTIGYHFRLSCIALIMLSLYYWHIHLYLFPGSFNRLFFFTIVVLSFSGADKTYSLSMKQSKGSFLAWEPVSVLPQRILAVQLTATYLGVGWQKFILKDWAGGEVLSYSFLGIWGSPFAFWFSRLNLPIEFYDWSVFITKSWEAVLPFALWWKPTRIWFLSGGVLFHFLIAVYLGIWWFLALYAIYPLVWEPEEMHCFLKEKCRLA